MIGGPLLLAAVSASILIVLASVWLALQLLRARLLGQSVRVSNDSLPEVQELVDDLRARVDYHRPVDIYITQKVTPSVSLTSYFGTKVIVIEGSLIGDIVSGENRAELSFVLARTFGALKARHQRFASGVVVLDSLKLLPWVSPFLLPYYRATTYSGDHLGLVCCGSLETALAATERLLVGKDVAVELRKPGVIAQAQLVRRRWLPRLMQLTLPEPHLTNRYVNLLLFSAHHDPAASDAFRESLDDATRARLDALARKSAYRHPYPRSRRRRTLLAAIAVGVTLAMIGGAAAMALSARESAAGTDSAAVSASPPPPPVAGLLAATGQSTAAASVMDTER